MRGSFILALAGLAALATPAYAVTNLIKNGSFEQGNAGTGGFTFWTKSNVPSNAPASIINYNSNANYPTGAFSESVAPDNTASLSPDAAGTKAAYFVGDFSVNETISQMIYLTPGNYTVGFSRYLPANGLANVGNSSFQVIMLGQTVTTTDINNASTGQTWRTLSGVVEIQTAGWYDTSLTFNSNASPSKDIVIDRVFAIRTFDPSTVVIPPSTIAVPEPATWAMLIIGFGLVGSAARRRRAVLVLA